MLDNGVGSLDASNVSPDHNVSVEPLLVDRIEVLRGPATLLYGSSAVGGVVNVIDNRIPAAAPDQPWGGRIEARYDSAGSERTGILALTAGNKTFALQANGLRTEADDVLYNAAREASTNVIKHAHAQHVWIDLQQCDGSVSLRVADDGVGISAATIARKADEGHIGMASMRARVLASGGHFDVRATSPGTELAISIPLRPVRRLVAA